MEELIAGHLPLVPGDAGAVDHTIQAAGDRGNEVVAILPLGDIAGAGKLYGALLGRAGELGRRLLDKIRDIDIRAQPVQGLDQCQADAGSAALDFSQLPTPCCVSVGLIALRLLVPWRRGGC